jgi:bifunctional non-homologous end joining protein LigD
MPISIPRAAVRAGLPPNLRLPLVSPCAAPPEGEGWLHEIKHDGHRLAALIAGPGSVKLLSRNGIDRTLLFRAPFRGLAASGRALVLDGEIAVPDERGVTHLDALTDALAGGRSERLAYFAFDLVYLDGHDLRRCPIEERKALLRQVLDEARSERIVYVDHVIGCGRQLFEAVQQIGAEGVVSKRLGRAYRGGETRDWLKAKCHKVGHFAITGFQELGEGRLEAVHVAEDIEGKLAPAGQVWLRGQRLMERARRAAPRAGEEKRGSGEPRVMRRDQILRTAQGRLYPRRRNLVAPPWGRRAGRVCRAEPLVVRQR